LLKSLARRVRVPWSCLRCGFYVAYKKRWRYRPSAVTWLRR
jgi:hypothetical protein